MGVNGLESCFRNHRSGLLKKRQRSRGSGILDIIGTHLVTAILRQPLQIDIGQVQVVQLCCAEQMLSLGVRQPSKAVQRLQGRQPAVVQGIEAFREGAPFPEVLDIGGHRRGARGQGQQGHGPEAFPDQVRHQAGAQLEGFASVGHVHHALPVGLDGRGERALVQGCQGQGFLF